MNPMLTVMAAEQSGSVNFKEGWDNLWGSLKQGTGFEGVLNLLAVIGVALVLVGFVGWIIKKATGKQMPGGQGGITWMLVLGALFTAPEVIIPLALTLFDLVANAFVSVFQNSTGSD